MLNFNVARNNCVIKKSLSCIKYVVLSFVAYSTVSTVVVAAEPPLTLNTAIKRAIERNPSLKVFRFREDFLAAQSQVADLTPAYELELEAEEFAGTGDLSSFESMELTVSLSSVIEMGDKRQSRVNVVTTQRSLLSAEREAESLELMATVTRHYINLLATNERLLLAKEAAVLAEEALNIVTKRAKAGATPEAEVKRAEASSAQAQLAFLSESQQLNNQKIALAALWGETKFSHSSIEGDLFRFGADIDFDVLFAKVERNPAIQVYAAKERLNQAELRLARTESKSDISWSIGFRQLQETNDSALVAGFSMPLFSSSRNKHAVNSTIAKQNETYVQREIAILNMHQQLYRAFHNRKQAIVTARQLQNSIIPALKQAMLETLSAYQTGRYSYLETVSARHELLGAKRMLIEAASAALRYGAEIEQLTAEPLSASQHAIVIQNSGQKK